MLNLLDDNDHPIQFIRNDVNHFFSQPVFFNSRCKMVSSQRKQQPTLFICGDDWRYIKTPSVTHKGAFGQDYEKVDIRKRFIETNVDGLDFSQDWFVVWKFPGDLNHLANSKNQKIFKKIFNIPLPVGEYPLRDDGWTGRYMSHESLPLETWVEKLRIDFPDGNGVHYLEARDDTRVAMIGSHYFIDAFWHVTSKEKTNVVNMLNELYHSKGIFAFPCYGQHHAIVFYVHLKNGKLITPNYLLDLLLHDGLKVVLEKYTKRSLNSWVKNFMSVTSKFVDESDVDVRSNTSVQKIHSQPHPTGSLLRNTPFNSSSWVSDIPVPNNSRVTVTKTYQDYSYISHKSISGWVRSRYLHPVL